MLDRDRLDPFSPIDFLSAESARVAYEEARRIQQAGIMLAGMRQQAGLTVQQVADKLNKQPDEVLRIERGQMLTSPAMSLMLQIAEICNEEISFRLRHGHL